jgi:ADP-ribose pyrophosphatase
MTRKRQTIEGRRVDALSPWVSLVEVAVRRDGEPVETYHGLEVADYVVVCARSSGGLIPVVRQFRPILGRTTLEFPAGLVDEGEAPAIAAAREFNEETGLTVDKLLHLGSHFTDTGRLSNRTHAYFAEASGVPTLVGDEVETVLLTPDALDRAIADEAFCHFLHVGAYALARTRKLI